jgi:hypothetical protein
MEHMEIKEVHNYVIDLNNQFNEQDLGSLNPEIYEPNS